MAGLAPGGIVRTFYRRKKHRKSGEGVMQASGGNSCWSTSPQSRLAGSLDSKFSVLHTLGL